ncbi:PSD1 and planctomycete cytochrome C domain-containing protein [Porifericola rhodea]|uniref:PSD1 and planctomycete cytochrome C domain-containing protein n=1 Tax=Porifericola rhodea TaxID=930972 RepID=UPI002666874C|nr:PSD1 and planctomycete cytochrome C domain-containing protein [Porifericola rhodea]WKN33538.1 PSD1 and planctomycete cytochrome C domain-containing protein [Porifericola rhodea]
MSKQILVLISAATLFLGVILFNQCSEKRNYELPQTVDFNFHIRPILVKNCYLCHGPDSSSREAELRLDTFADATLEREDGNYAILPGHADQSLLMSRILSDDPNEIMPPPESNLSLSEREKALLKKWIEQGAEWKPHWAFIPPTLPEVPKVQSEQLYNEIDAFVLSRLHEKKLEPAGIADKSTLARRLSFLLTGLPPKAAELDRFVADQSESAYEKMVDYYLNSPAFGERWARHWMDLVRYAETKGHEFDYPVQGAWQYRDYLIRAFNENISYDQLVREHLAGDLLSSPRWNKKNGQNESRLATMFFAMSEGKHSPVDLKIDEAERIDNIIDVTTKTFQALTVSCSRCHDHKFDPIPATDYYALYGIVKSTRFGVQDAGLGLEEVQSVEELKKVRQDISTMLAQTWMDEKNVLPAQQVSLQLAKLKSAEYMLGDFRDQSLDGWQSDGVAFGNQTTLGKAVFNSAGTKLVGLSEGKASSTFAGLGQYGALRSPNFTITDDYIGIRALGKAASIRIVIDNFQLIRNPIYGELEIRVDSESWKNFSVDVSSWKGHKAYIEIMPGYYDNHAYKLPENSFVEVEYAIKYNKQWPQIASPPQAHGQYQALKKWAAQEGEAGDIQLLQQQLQVNALPIKSIELQELIQKEEVLLHKLSQSTSSFYAAISDGFAINSPVFIRGNTQSPSNELVPRRFLSSISTVDSVFNSPGSGREELAQAILSDKNPLTARVMVNRIWHHMFGRGIVETVDNFGLQGKLPTHPALLDFLAVKFKEGGWSIKQMIKYIAMSATFQRAVAAESLQDPENLWLAGFPLRRIEAEAIRDAMLSVSGRLDTSRYGPPVAVHLTDFMQGRGRPRHSGPLDGAGRRSIYLEVRRNFLSPMMLAFDRPIPFSTFGKRNVTNVPAQSLILMNDPFVAEQAEYMARQLIKQQTLSTNDRIQWVYRRALSRAATEQELEEAKHFLKQQARAYKQSEADIHESLEVWRDYCHTVFNLKEFIYLI